MEKYLDTRDTEKTNLCMLYLLFKIFNTLLILNFLKNPQNKIACLEQCYAVWRLRNIVVYRLHHISLSVTIADTNVCMMCKCCSSHSLIISS